MVPRSVAPVDVLGSALRIYRDQAGVLLGAAVVIFAVEALLGVVLDESLGFLVSVVSLIAGTFYQGMVVELVRDVQDGRRDASVADLFRTVAPVVGPLIAVSLLLGLGVALGFLLVIVPGFLALTFWAVAAPVTVIERPGILAAFGRSRELVRGHGWPVFGVIVLLLLVVLTVGIVVGIAFANASDPTRAIVSWVVSVLTAPLTALAASVLYFALRREHGEPVTAGGPEYPGHVWN